MPYSTPRETPYAVRRRFSVERRIPNRDRRNLLELRTTLPRS